MNPGKIFLIPTAISENSGEPITHEVKSAIKNTEYFLVEKIRTSRRFISSLKLDLEIESLNFQEIEKKFDFDKLTEMLSPVFEGHNIGVMSEAGMPCIADPGNNIVQYAHHCDIRVVPLSGPNSIIMGLIGSGFNGQRFTFHGYLPIEKGERKKKIIELEKSLQKTNYTQIFMETPYRNESLLDDLIRFLNPSTLLSISANLTSQEEIVKTKSIANWKKNRININKKPAVFSIGNF